MKKIIALALVLISVLCLFAGCSSAETVYDEIVLPVQNVEDTVENRQKAQVETGLAYYYKIPYVQYDWTSLTPVYKYRGSRSAEGMSNTPEMAGPQRTLYQVCSIYTYQIIYHCFDHNLHGGTENTSAGYGAKVRHESEPYTVWHWVNPAQNSPEAFEKMEEFRSILQPGDMIYYTRHHQSGNHTVMWAGDLDGDGYDDILNVDGSGYDTENAVEKREENAVAINYRSGSNRESSYFFGEKCWDYFPKLKEIAVIRFADEKHIENLPLTERAKTRILYPGLEIYYEVEGGIYGSVVKDGEITYTLHIENNSQQDHKGIQVQMPVPENATVVKKDGKECKNGIVRWTLDIPADGVIERTYTVKATGEVGDIINSGVGYVHAIPLPELYTGIVSRKVDAETVKTSIEKNKNHAPIDFANAYLADIGVAEEQEDFLTYMVEKKTILDLHNLQKQLFHIITHNNRQMLWWKDVPAVIKEHRPLAKMRITDYYGGQQTASDAFSNRVKELRAEDLETGDIFIWVPKTETTAPAELVTDPCMIAIHDGENLICVNNGTTIAMSQEDLDALLMCNFFIALRPTQAPNTHPGNPNL